MAGVETARTIKFTVRKLVVQPINNAPLPWIPIVIDTLTDAQLKFTVALDAQRGGAYLLPLAIDPKEMSIDISAKLPDVPPSLAVLLTPGIYAKVATPGPAIDSTVNLVGTSAAARIVATITSMATPPSGLYIINATAAQSYTVYDMQTGKAAAPVATSAVSPTTDTTSIAGVTLTTGISPTTFTVGDICQVEVINIGAAAVPGDASMETITGPTVWPATLPQCQLLVDATRRGVIYQYLFYYCLISGETIPLAQGKYAVSDFTAQVQQPPFGAPSQVPYRYRRLS